ncbi:MAG: hypothetical protein WBG95_03080 [Sulfitobacter sp.]
MKVFAVYENPLVLVACPNNPAVFVADYEDLNALDLVAHFLGIAMHDNVNAAPSSLTANKGISGTNDV